MRFDDDYTVGWRCDHALAAAPIFKQLAYSVCDGDGLRNGFRFEGLPMWIFRRGNRTDVRRPSVENSTWIPFYACAYPGGSRRREPCFCVSFPRIFITRD